jgi:regulator of cell morphogenesis and NO signaling
METNLLKDKFLGDIVAEDIRTAGLFKDLGIDFCCGGKKTLDQACKEKNIDSSQLLQKIVELEPEPKNPQQNFKDWDISFLIDYIVNVHHNFVKKSLPDLILYTRKIAAVHGSHHPELIEVANQFEGINNAILPHLKKEEEIFFPAIKAALLKADQATAGTIKSGMVLMDQEHEFVGQTMDSINQLTSGYKLPEDACNTYRLAFSMLSQFEDDLHIHVHLENNILFPKALKLATFGEKLS